MGIGRIKAAVADAGPLIHLAEIGCLSFLRLFERLYIPQAIWSETVGQDRVAQASLLELNNIERQSPTQTEVSQFVKYNRLETLHTGECESLYVCQQTGTTILLTDDMAVREITKQLKLTPVGSLGIVVRAYYFEFRLKR
jgi:predicted nucleic acid-binding protein